MNLVASGRQPVFDGRVLFERETLLSALRACLTEAGAGHGRLVALSGEAGIGKSSLVRRLIEDSSGVRVLIGVCDGVLPRVRWDRSMMSPTPSAGSSRVCSTDPGIVSTCSAGSAQCSAID